MNLLPAVI